MSRTSERRRSAPPTDPYLQMIAGMSFRSNAAPRRDRSRSRSPKVKREPPAPAAVAPVVEMSPPVHPAPMAPPKEEDLWQDIGDLTVYNVHFDEPVDDDYIFNQKHLTDGRFYSSDEHPLALPAPEPVQPPEPVAVPDADQAAMDACLLDFAQKIRPPQFMSESEFLHMHGHLTSDADAAMEPGEVPAKAAGQHRPLGSVLFMNRLPKEMKTCPCRCNTRNPCSDVSITDLLNKFVQIGYLRDGEPLQLLLPGADQYVDRLDKMPQSVGHFRIMGGAFAFVDAASGEAHCCAVMWAFMSYLTLCADDKLLDIDKAAKQIREQLKLRSHALRFVRVQALNVTLWQMASSYRHDLGKWLNVQPADGARGRTPLKVPPADVKFKTRDELRVFFSSVCDTRFDPTSLWMAMLQRRIRELNRVIEGYREQVAVLTRTGTQTV